MLRCQPEFAGLNFLLNLLERCPDSAGFGGSQDVCCAQHLDVGNAPGNIFPEQLLVEIDGRGELQRNVSQRFREPSTPKCFMSHRGISDCRKLIRDC